MMRTTITIAFVTALAAFALTPSVARASNDAGLPVAVGTSDLAGVQDVQVDQTGDQGQVQAEQSGDQGAKHVDQSGDQGEMQAEQSGDQGAKQVEQSGDQGNTQVDQSGEQG